MNILVVNDDGVDAAGIHRLAQALTEGGHDVYVCAPTQQQSATGHGITIGRPVRMARVERAGFPEAKAAVAMDGTPADCVKFGLELYGSQGVAIDAVFSGFNHGMNLGTDTLYSGTVSAAVEGAMCGLPAAALSISSNESFHRTPAHFGYAMRLAQRVAAQMEAGGAEATYKGAADAGLGLDYIYRHHTILNINVPDLPDAEIRGLKVAPLSYREYEEWFDRIDDGDAEGAGAGYSYSGRPKVIGEAEAEESDIIANAEGYATITPLQFDLTSHALLEEARRAWEGVEI